MVAKLRIPETAVEMQEMMDDPKVAAQIIEAGQWSEFTRAYAKATDERGEMAELIRNSVAVAMEGHDEIVNRVDSRVNETVKKILGEHGVNAAQRPQLGTPEFNVRIAPGGAGARMNAAYNPLAIGKQMDDIGFQTIGEFVRTGWHKNQNPDRDKLDKMKSVMNTFSGVEPSAGGFLIPESMRAEILEIALAEAIVRSRATVITLTNPTQLVPFVDATTNVGSVMGGFVFYWTPEQGTIQMSTAKFGRTKLEANKLVGGSAVPNELWSDAPALTSWIMNALPKGIAFYEDLAFFTGSGVGEPVGFLNPANKALISIPKESGQSAKTILTANILKMYSRMLPSSLENAVWIVNQTTFPQLMSLTIDVGTGGAPVMLMDIRSAPNITMLGRPVIFTEKVPALGSAGDINFVDLSYYLVGDRQAVSVETSEHARFETDETLLRVIERVDGRPWIQSPIQPLNGDPLSPFLQLGAR